jgi:hypothetical protein
VSLIQNIIAGASKVEKAAGAVSKATTAHKAAAKAAGNAKKGSAALAKLNKVTETLHVAKVRTYSRSVSSRAT